MGPINTLIPNLQKETVGAGAAQVDNKITTLAQEKISETTITITNEDRQKILKNMLFTICEKGNVKLLETVLQQGANVNCENNEGQTPLHIACLFGHFEIVELLVQKGAEIHAMNKEYKIPMTLALEGNHTPIVEFLLSKTMTKGIQLPSDILEELPSIEQLITNYEEIKALFRRGKMLDFLLLLNGIEQANKKVDALGHYLVLASNEGDLDIVMALLNKGVYVNAKGDKNYTPLHAACLNGHNAIVNLLLKQKGVELDAKNEQGLCPLYLACAQGFSEIIKNLLKSGAQPSCAMLHEAITTGKTNVVKCLVEHFIKKKIDINSLTTKHGYTPLHHASATGKLGIVNYLLSLPSINIDAEDFEGGYPIHLACLKGYHEIVKRLLDNGAKLDSSRGRTILQAIESQHIKTIECVLNHLINKKIDINSPNESNKNNTPLHFICNKGYTRIFELFLRYKSKLTFTVPNDAGMTPLHQACCKGHPDIVELWIAHNLPLNTKTIEYDFTPLHFAVGLNQAEIVDLLLKSGKVDIFVTTKGGLTAMDFAVDMNNEVMLDILRKNGIALISDEECFLIQERFLQQVNESEEEPDLIEEETPQSTPSPISIPLITPLATDVIPTKKTTKLQKNKHIQTTPSIKLTKSKAAKTQYQVLIHEKFKWPKSLNKGQQANMIENLKKLKYWPISHLDAKKLKSMGENIYRLRVDSHRVIFSVDTDKQEIKIHEIGLRKNIYKNMNSKLGKS